MKSRDLLLSLIFNYAVDFNAGSSDIIRNVQELYPLFQNVTCTPAHVYQKIYFQDRNAFIRCSFFARTL